MSIDTAPEASHHAARAPVLPSPSVPGAQIAQGGVPAEKSGAAKPPDHSQDGLPDIFSMFGDFFSGSLTESTKGDMFSAKAESQVSWMSVSISEDSPAGFELSGVGKVAVATG